jgi:hypothetical protein
MIKKWAKIDRATGNVLKYKREKELKRVLNKKYVWVEEIEGERPSYDPDKQQIRPKPTLPDLSDLSKSVDASVQRVINYEVVNLSDEQVESKVIEKIVWTDKRMARITEDLLSILVCKGDVKWTDFKEEVQEIINDRRTKRGKADLSASSALTFQDPYA